MSKIMKTYQDTDTRKTISLFAIVDKFGRIYGTSGLEDTLNELIENMKQTHYPNTIFQIIELKGTYNV